MKYDEFVGETKQA